jgi:hypothetical protein
MDEIIVKRSVEWILDAQAENQKGWGQFYKKGYPSITVTSEVVTALSESRSQLRESNLLDRATTAISNGVTFIEETLPRRRDLDLTNVASALIACAKASLCGVTVPLQMVEETCLPKLWTFCDLDGRWHPTDQTGQDSSFAAYLAIRALREIRRCQAIYPNLSERLRHEVQNVYEKTSRFIEHHVFRDDGSCIDAEQTIRPTATPAITSLGLHYRIIDLSDHNPALITKSEAIKRCVAYLRRCETQITEDWTYQLRNTHYELCFLPYLVQALSMVVERLDSPEQDETLAFYYRLALFASGNEVFGANPAHGHQPSFWWKKRKTDASEAKVWVAAHFLSGIAAVQVARRELLVLVKHETEREALEARIGNQTAVAVDAEGWRLGRPGKSIFWLQASLGVMNTVGIALLVVLVGAGGYADDFFTKIGAVICSFILSGYLAWEYLKRRDDKQSIAGKHLTAIGISLAIASIVWTVSFQSFSNFRQEVSKANQQLKSEKTNK